MGDRNTQPAGARGTARLREKGDPVKVWLSSRRPHDDCPERWTCYRTEACVGYNGALASGAEVEVLDALWTEYEAAMAALRRLRPRTVEDLERSEGDG